MAANKLASLIPDEATIAAMKDARAGRLEAVIPEQLQAVVTEDEERVRALGNTSILADPAAAEHLI